MLSAGRAMSSEGVTGDGACPRGDAIVALIEQQASLYQRLRRLALRQRDLVRSEDPSQLLSLLAERRKMTDELAESAGHMADVRAKWNELGAELSEPQRDRTEKLLTEIRAVASEIIASDSDDMGLLEVRKRRVGEELNRSPARGAMLTAYGAKAGAERPDRMDEES